MARALAPALLVLASGCGQGGSSGNTAGTSTTPDPLTPAAETGGQESSSAATTSALGEPGATTSGANAAGSSEALGQPSTATPTVATSNPQAPTAGVPAADVVPTATGPASSSESTSEGSTATTSETTSAPDTAPVDTATGTASTTSATSDTAPTGTLEVSGLKIEPNPKMSLSCFVSWTTSTAASSEVQFGIDSYQFRVVDSTEVTEHRVHVVGMHAETAYRIKAVSSNQDALGSAEGDFTTGKLPTGLPAQGTLIANAREKMQPGWTLTNFQVGGSSNFSTSPAIIVMVDEEGIPVWYFVHGTTADQFGMTSTEWLPNGHVLVGNASSEPAREVDLEGNILWEGPTGGTPALSHHTSKLSTGNYLVVRESNTSARVEELSPDNKVVWTWDLYDHVQPKSNAADWCHLNSVSVDPTENFLYFNCRFQGLFKVDRSNKTLLWQLGAAIDDSNSGDITYLPDNGARFNDSHDPEVHADGTILFYDNQGWASHTGGEGNGSYHSRVVEYTLDEVSKEATLSWQFPGDFAVDPWFKNDWSTPIWGDADRLDNGNVLVTAGVRGAGTHTRIFEVTKAGEVVWGIEWPENNGSYRAGRIVAPVQPIP